LRKPEPKIGLVVKYDYLWYDQARAGQQQGFKDRPCAIIARRRVDETGDYKLLLLPITHTSIVDKKDGLVVPPKLRRYLGLDDEQSWLKTSEYNEVMWSDPGIIPAKQGQWEYGFMPRTLTEAALRQTRQHARNQDLTKVDRTQDLD